METKLLEKHGEPGGDRSRGWHRKHVSYSFCDVQQSLELLILRDSRTLRYVYGTRARREAKVCKTFIRRFDSDPRLQYPTTLSSNRYNSLGQKLGRFPTAPRLRAFALYCGTSAGTPGPKPDSSIVRFAEVSLHA